MPNACITYEMPTAGPPQRWVSIKVAASDSRNSERTITRWADKGLILADRPASGTGAWIIALNKHNLPISTRPFRDGKVEEAGAGETAP